MMRTMPAEYEAIRPFEDLFKILDQLEKLFHAGIAATANQRPFSPAEPIPEARSISYRSTQRLYVFFSRASLSRKKGLRGFL